LLKDKNISIIYACSIVNSYGVLRLSHTQNIDIWLAIYFLLLILFLEKPKNKNSYFLLLGIFSGFLIGTKYTGPLYFLILSVFYFKNFIKYIDFHRVILFLIPFSFLGLFWYIRNLILTGSPFYPQTILFFHGLKNWNSYLGTPILKAIVISPDIMFNVAIQEYMLWPIIIVSIFLILFFNLFKGFKAGKLKKFIFISFFVAVIYLISPYNSEFEGRVLTMRYAYSLFSLLTLIVIMYSKRINKVIYIALLAFVNGLVIFTNPYHPKILFLVIPLVLILSIFIKNKDKVLGKTI
jgi:hypothetical protein